ncbi:hypothetical protein DM02DRAFT_513272 [Periconia macrospinosa]|uniref:Uncharacterized protein n=1 Tax=Periconia macrospinosa TaxID=97972 RepID=A0A2V1E9M0_9PLEO|nr:hypothetical protein DM02DRAFT_513272 [Periconia macrospinosa]
MFVPRALRLKGHKEPSKPKPATVQQPDDATTQSQVSGQAQTPAGVPQKTAVEDQRIPSNKSDIKPGAKGSRFTTAPVTPEFLAQLVAGVELIFTDYAHQQPEHAKWLQQRYRTIDGEQKYVHFTAILEHGTIMTLKPQPTQLLLRQALQEVTTQFLEMSSNGFYVRRKPSTYPLSWVPENSFSVTDDHGLGFWDQRTIYVEPHIRHLCKTPAKVAHWLKEHGALKPKWLPIQAVHTLYNSCAFVVLSGNVLHKDVWFKWRETGKPEDWKIMTKVEHTKRTEEYLELLKKNNAKIKRPRYPSLDTETAKTLDENAVRVSGPAEEHPPTKKRRLKLKNYPVE